MQDLGDVSLKPVLDPITGERRVHREDHVRAGNATKRIGLSHISKIGLEYFRSKASRADVQRSLPIAV